MTPEEFLGSLEGSRQEEIRRLDQIVMEEAPDLERKVHGAMLVYGPFRYRTGSGCEGWWSKVGIASRKGGITMHFACGVDREIEGASNGVGCVKIKRLEKVDIDALRRLIRHASTAENPNEVAVP